MPTKVLIVDDSTLARRTLRTMLEEMGYSVEEASDGAEAMECFHLRRHDLVLLDLVMIGMCGTEVLAKLREHSPTLPIVMVTADTEPGTRTKVLAAGAAALINKPLSKSELTEVLDTVLAKEW